MTAVIEPGDYMIEVQFGKLVRRDVLEHALRDKLGFADVRLDGNVHEIMDAQQRILFTAKASEGMVLNDTSLVSYGWTRKLTFDPFSGLSFRLTQFPLLYQATYHVRFISYVKAMNGKASVEEALRLMGWEVIKICQLQRNMKVPRRQAIDTALWCGELVWKGPDSLITEADPFCFEDCFLVSSPDSSSNQADTFQEKKEDSAHERAHQTRRRDDAMPEEGMDSVPRRDESVSEEGARDGAREPEADRGRENGSAIDD